MAGIGFRLQKLLAEETLSSTVKAYAFSALIAAGPFLLTVLIVSLVHVFAFSRLTTGELTYFQTLITYTFMFSLITIGVCHLVITRYVADDYYRGHIGGMTAVFLSTLLANWILWGPPALAFAARLSIDWTARLGILLLYFSVTGTWLAILFLSAARDYVRISRAFVIGAAISVLLAYFMGEARGFTGYFLGFVLGQAAVFGLLCRAVIVEFGYRETRDWHWLTYFRRYPRLAAIGVLYNLGIWIDKIMFWISTEGVAIDMGLRHTPVYDSPMFFAYLTIVPSLAYFLVQMETDFFYKYHAYYRGIQRQESLPQLELRRRDIIASLGYSLRRLLVVQGVISGLAMLLVPWLTQLTRMDPLQMGILRIGIFAAFLQAGVLIVINVLLYFDLQREALRSAAVFCVLNALLTWASSKAGLPAFGYGYTLACLLSLGVAVYYLNDRLQRLHYLTFMLQTVPKPIVIQDEPDELSAAMS